MVFSLRKLLLSGSILLALGAGAVRVYADSPEEITIYSGRSETLIGGLLAEFTKDTGIKLNVRYGATAEMAAQILEEGKKSPADLFFAQDAGALGALAVEDKLDKLPDNLLNRVPKKFRSPEGLWVGTSGRSRVVIYNTTMLKESDLPPSVLDFTDSKWKGKLGWAPSNGSFQAFITAMRLKLGEDAARNWLKGIIANEPKVYPNNSSIVAACGAGEVQAGFVNHYYLVNFLKERGDSFPARNYYPKGGDVGAMLNVAGVAMLKSSTHKAATLKLIDYLLSPKAQEVFVGLGESEYPMIEGVKTNPALKPLSEIEAPEIDLGKISDLKGTLALLKEVGALE